MKQQNVGTGKEREILPPRGLKAPSKPIVPAGPTMTVRVPPNSAGTTIHVPHPKLAGQFIAVEVPKNAREGQAMMVPVPMKQLPEECSDEPPPAASAPALPEHKPVVAEAVAMA